MSLEISGLTVRFGDLVAVDGLDLSIPSGERFAVMGPSGSGKSTLLRAIAGLEPSSGSITIDGARMETAPTHERPIGMMFQDYALFPHLDVAANIGFGLRMAGVPVANRDRRVAELLELVGLPTFGDRNVATLSGGEQQRVALARTLAPDPSLVLFDEPLGAIDQDRKDSLIGEMRHVMDETGITSIYVTHDRIEAEAFAARIGILRSGRLERVDRPEGLWTDPRTTFVARFVGHRNIVDATSLGLGEGTVVVPVRAVTLTDPGSSNRRGVVTACVFRDGAYEVTVEVGDTSVVAQSTRRFDDASAVGVDIDVTAVVALSVDEV